MSISFAILIITQEKRTRNRKRHINIKCKQNKHTEGYNMARAKKTITSNEARNLPFPTRLRELLETSGETQEKLANAIGAKRQSIGQWKDGITTPDINALNKIADYYKVSTDYLLGRIEVKSPETTNMAIHEKTGLSDEAIDILNRKNIESYVVFSINGETRHGPISNNNQIKDIENSGGKIIATIKYNFIKAIDVLIKNERIIDCISDFLFTDFINADNPKGSFHVHKKGEAAPTSIPISPEEINRVYLLRAQTELMNLKEKLKKEGE